MKMNKLSNEEFNVLNKISSKSKMDCWFYLKQDKDGNDYVYDLEQSKELSLTDGILMLDNNITSIDDYELSEDEKCIYISLIYKINTKFFPSLSRLRTLLSNALTMLEEAHCYSTIIGTDLEIELGITQEEYDAIMEE